MTRITTLAATLALAAGSTFALGQGLPLATTIAAQGDPAPGAPANVNLNIINVLDLTNDANAPAVSATGGGLTVYRADLSGTGTTASSNVGLFAGPYASTTLVAREGLTAAGAPVGVNWSDFSLPRINAGGTIAFTATLVGAGITSANNEGIWRGLWDGTLTQVAVRGQNAGLTAVPAAVFSDVLAETVRLSDTGDLAFFATLTGAGVIAAADRGIWRVDPAGALSTIAIENEQAAGLATGVLYADFTDPGTTDTNSLVLGGTSAAWISTLRGTGVTTSNDGAAFARNLTTNTTSFLFREADTAVSLFGTGAAWGAPGSVSINATGQIALRTAITGVPTTTNAAIVVFPSTAGGTPTIAVRKGDLAPILTGLTFSDLLVASSSASISPKIDQTGGVYFLGVLAGTGVTAANNQLLTYKPATGPAEAILRRGTQLPGALTGVLINVINSFSINDDGNILLSVTLSGTGVTSGNDNAILAVVNTSGGRVLRVLSRENDVVNVATNLTRTMNSGSITLAANSTFNRNNSAGADGYRAILAGDGTFVYRAYFTDGSSRLLAVNATALPCSPSDVAGANQSVGYDGSLTADDIIVFLGWYFASDSRADVAGANQSTTPDTQFTADDIIVFLGRYFAGC